MLPCSSCGRQLADDGRCAHCEAPTVAAPPPSSAISGVPSPQVVSGVFPAGFVFDGKYRIERQLGVGGMSLVYLATELTVDAPVVIKSLLPQLSRDPSLQERLLREAKALARIDHPNVVRLKSAVLSQGELFIVMEYVEGEDLSALVKRWRHEGPGELEHILKLFGQVLDGVEAAHFEGIVHRDIKPSNVLVRARDGRVKVSDFGIAKVAEQVAREKHLTGGMLGTLWYMAPEQLRADPSIDERADIYALGVLLFELLTGRVPFDAPSDYGIAHKHLHDPLPSIHALRPSLSAAEAHVLQRTIEGACAKDRTYRLASCDAFRRSLEALSRPRSAAPEQPATSTQLSPSATRAKAQTPAQPIPPPSEPSPPASSTKRALFAVGALVVVSALGLGAYATLGGEAKQGSGAKQDEPKRPRDEVRRPTTSAATQPTAVATGRACKSHNECVEAPDKATPACVEGRCTFKCNAGLMACGSACIDAKRDLTHCGGCEPANDCTKQRIPAGATATCKAGACGFTCPAGQFDCGDACLDLSRDVKHCGACAGPGSDCTAEPLPAGAKATCAEGRCSFVCATSAQRCGKGCCASGQRCEDDACVD